MTISNRQNCWYNHIPSGYKRHFVAFATETNFIQHWNELILIMNRKTNFATENLWVRFDSAFFFVSFRSLIYQTKPGVFLLNHTLFSIQMCSFWYQMDKQTNHIHLFFHHIHLLILRLLSFSACLETIFSHFPFMVIDIILFLVQF